MEEAINQVAKKINNDIDMKYIDEDVEFTILRSLLVVVLVFVLHAGVLVFQYLTQ